MIYDVLGIGFGPSNLALAIACKENKFNKKILFLEKQEGCYWHSNMLLSGSDIQNNPLRDLITPVNPSSNYTFIQYLQKTGKFFDYLNLGLHYPLRKDFHKYVEWVSKDFDDIVKYNTTVESIHIETSLNEKIWIIKDKNNNVYKAKKLILGTGRNLNIPHIFKNIKNAYHLVNYLPSLKNVDKNQPVAVIGSSQSAVEILLDLHSRGFKKILSIHRSFSFRLKDTSPFSDEVYFPNFIDYYHKLSVEDRFKLESQVRGTNYSSADADVLNALYLKLYEDKLDNIKIYSIYNNHVVTNVVDNPAKEIEIQDIYTKEKTVLPVSLIILATGFLDVGRNGKEGLCNLLKDHQEMFLWDKDCLVVERDYRIRFNAKFNDYPDLYMNGLCESSHGLGDAGSFSLVSYRARDILNSINR